jgi:hypothetical protein
MVQSERSNGSDGFSHRIFIAFPKVKGSNFDELVKNKDNLKYSMTVILALLKTIGDEGVTFIVDEEASEYFRSIWDKCESYKFKGVVVDPYLR